MGRTNKRLTDWARQMIVQLFRWLSNRTVVVVSDSSYAALGLCAFCQSILSTVTCITRLRLDDALYEPTRPRLPGQMGRPLLKGQRLSTLGRLLESTDTFWTRAVVSWCDGVGRTLEFNSHTAVWCHTGKPRLPIRWLLIRDPKGRVVPQALLLLCTAHVVAPVRIIEGFVLRWQVGVTFQEARAYLGVETQRQWSDRASAHTTPVLLGLFSWVILVASLLQNQRSEPHGSAAWYAKHAQTFAHVIALVRCHLWSANEFFVCRTRNLTSEKSLSRYSTDS